MYGAIVNVVILYEPGCPSWQMTVERLRGLAAEFHLTVTSRPVDDPPPPEYSGSPTILFDGCDPFPRSRPADATTCRLYLTEYGITGVPSTETLRAAIRRELTADTVRIP